MNFGQKQVQNSTYRVDDVEFYLSGLNWVPNWIQNHFFNKISDFLLSLILILIISSIFLIKFKNKITKKKFLFILFSVILLQWMVFKSPSSGYGGFTLVALSIFIPSSIFLESRLNLNSKIKKITF